MSAEHVAPVVDEQLSFDDLELEVQPQERHLTVVPDSSEAATEADPIESNADAHDNAPNANVYGTEQVEELVTSVETKVIPSSIEEAEVVIGRMADLKSSIALLDSSIAGAEKIDPEVVTSVNEIVERGVDNWRLSDRERSAWQEVSATADPKSLSKDAKSLANFYLDGGTDALTTKNYRDNLQVQAGKRLALDASIRANDAPEEPSKSPVKGAEDNSIADLVRIDGNNRGHRVDGKFLSAHELQLIKDNEGQIRSGLPDILQDIARVDGRKRAHSPDGKFMTQNEISQIADNQEQIRKGVAELNPVALVRPDTISQETWDALTDDERSLVLEMTTQVVEPVTNDAEPELRGRIRRAMGKSRDFVYGLTGRVLTAGPSLNGRLKDMLNDQEKGKQRKIIAGSIIGALAATGAAVLIFKGIDTGHGHKPVAGIGHKPPVQHGAGGSGSAAHEAQPAITLKPGQTVWELERQAHPNASNEQIQQLTGKALKRMGISWQQARKLRPGRKIDL